MNVRLACFAVLSSLVAVACSAGDTSSPGGGTTPTGGGTTDPPATTSPGKGTPTPTPTPSPTTPPTPIQTETWADGKTLTTSIDIVAGAVVTITPGAKITVAAGVSITVHGTLTGDAKANHASITGPSWDGIIVASGGTLTLTGVDLGGAGIQANAGDKSATYDYGTITSGNFTVDKGATLDTHHAAFVMGGSTSVSGTFTASYLDYAGSDITLDDPTATVSVADSKLTATGGDFFVSNTGATLHVEYSVISGSHCPFHFTTLGVYTLDHVATRGNAFGQMFYNPDTTPNTISFSSFEDPHFDQTDRLNVININDTYIKTMETIGAVKQKNISYVPVTAAAPRGRPGPG